MRPYNNIFFHGVVEDRNDPELLGRIKVRFFGVHSPDKQDIPTEDLVWATVLYHGNQVFPLYEGTWVVGYFEDEDLQYPVILGKTLGNHTEKPSSDTGFSDDGKSINDRPKEISSRTINEDGTGSTFSEERPARYPKYVGESEISRLARNEKIEETIVEHKKNTIALEIPTAAAEVGAIGTAWNEIETPYNSKYPYNHVREYESGHVLEVDDTPDAERIHEFHRSGTFKEIHPDGSLISKTVNDKTDITIKDKKTVVYGNNFSYIQGSQNLLTTGKTNKQYNDDYLVIFDTNSSTKIGGNKTEYISGNFGLAAPEITLAGKVHLGATSVSETGVGTHTSEEPVVMGDKLVVFLDSLLTYIDSHIHPTPVGPSGPPIIPVSTSTVPIKQELSQLLSEIVSTQ